ncbi:MAG: hypothetical protein QNJ85_09900 [Gammaproteobacteria bacterium]|nr:hypothetical protein [Gammaproteobacteria bacterium]
MELRFHINKSRRELLPALALVFLLQSVAPAFAGVMASPVAGFFDVLCTLSGPQQVFVSLERQSQEPPACHECPACILQLGLDDEAGPAAPMAAARAQLRHAKPAGLAAPSKNSRHFSRYLSRAPPA